MASVWRPLCLSSFLAGSNGLKLRLPKGDSHCLGIWEFLSDSLSRGRNHHTGYYPRYAREGSRNAFTPNLGAPLRLCHSAGNVLALLAPYSTTAKSDSFGLAIAPRARTKRVDGGRHGTDLGRPTEAFKVDSAL